MADLEDINLETKQKIELLNVQKQIEEVQKKSVALEKEMLGLDASRETHMKKAFVDIVKRLREEQNVRKKLEIQSKDLLSIQSSSARATAKHNLASAESYIKRIQWIKKEINLQLDDQISKLKEIKQQREAIDNFWSKAIKDRIGLEFKEFSAYKQTHGELIKIFPNIKSYQAGLISGVLILISFARNLYDMFEKAAASFRMYIGMTRSAARQLRAMAEDITTNFTKVGVTIDGAYKSIEALGTEMGSVRNVSYDLVKTVSILSSQLGVSEENSAQMLRNLAAASKSTIQSQKSMSYFTAAMTEAAGVPLNAVMADVAKMSGTTFAMISKTPMALIRASIEARRLNTTINDISRASEQILNFTTSVASEMEASVLIGRAINLQRARELSYRKDILGATKEILKITKEVDFENLDVFQMQAFAHATGHSVDELMKMIQAQKQLDIARTDPNLSAQVAAYERLRESNSMFAKDVASNYEMQLQQRSNQEMMVAIQNQWNQLLMQAGKLFLPIIHGMLSVLGAAMNIVPPIAFFIQSLSILGSFWGKLGNTLSRVALIGGRFAAFLGPLGRFGSLFLKILGPIGWVITAFQLIASLVKNLDLKAPFFGLDKVINEVLLQPFKDAWNWISNLFSGNSPSKLALSIVKGLVSVQTMLFNALTSPFRLAFNWILSKITGKSIENAVISSYAPETKSVPTVNATTLTRADAKKEAVQSISNQTDESNTLLNSILNAINILNKNLESGKIGVYIDGQLMSATIARQTNFRNGYGMNSI